MANMEDGDTACHHVRLGPQSSVLDKCKHCKKVVCCKDRHVTMVTTA